MGLLTPLIGSLLDPPERAQEAQECRTPPPPPEPRCISPVRQRMSFPRTSQSSRRRGRRDRDSTGDLGGRRKQHQPRTGRDAGGEPNARRGVARLTLRGFGAPPWAHDSRDPAWWGRAGFGPLLASDARPASDRDSRKGYFCVAVPDGRRHVRRRGQPGGVRAARREPLRPRPGRARSRAVLGGGHPRPRPVRLRALSDGHRPGSRSRIAVLVRT